jgi:hypothetical protein
MKFPKYLTKEQVKQLEFEVLSKDFLIYLTRILLDWTEDTEYLESVIARKNRIINLSRTITGDKIYVLESDDMGVYEQAEYDWHDSNFLLAFRRLDTIEFIEFACELLRSGYFDIDFLNVSLKKERASFRFRKNDQKLEVEVFKLDEIEEADISEEHPNIRLLVSRMDNFLENEDYSGVLHSSASIFETMAKDVVGIPTVQDKTLKSFFERYKLDSNLPEPILDYILDTYNKRNVTPLAGHGSLKEPNINKEQSIILSEMTKTIVRIEGKLKGEE